MPLSGRDWPDWVSPSQVASEIGWPARRRTTDPFSLLHPPAPILQRHLSSPRHSLGRAARDCSASSPLTRPPPPGRARQSRGSRGRRCSRLAMPAPLDARPRSRPRPRPRHHHHHDDAAPAGAAMAAPRHRLEGRGFLDIFVRPARQRPRGRTHPLGRRPAR